VTADNSSLPEVAGEAALLVSATDDMALAEAIRRLMTIPALRDQYRQRGFEQVKQFSWESAARNLLAVYETFDSNHSSRG
jgi:glycosyltransferase involved in cell wall biosynthesis